MPPIYLDNAASTRVADEAIALMTEVMRTAWGNPSSSHPQGAAAREAIAIGRKRLLVALGDADGNLGDIIWTSGCTEADALAVVGAARMRDGHVVVSAIEHPAVSEAAKSSGKEVRAIAPGPDGVLDPDAIAAAAIGASVVAIVMVQNEVGVVQPIAALASAIRKANPSAHIHVDAAQAFGKVTLDVTTLGADSIALAAHKMHGPKGVGALWLRRGTTLSPLWVGGGQQGGMRGGTQDAPSVAGFGLAVERSIAQMPSARTRWLELAEIVATRLAAKGITNVKKLVPDVRRAPHILALGVPHVAADALRTTLSSRGVYVSTGSACADKGGHGAGPSPVLVALGLPESDGMVRLSFSLDTTSDDVERASDTLADVITQLR